MCTYETQLSKKKWMSPLWTHLRALFKHLKVATFALKIIRF